MAEERKEKKEATTYEEALKALKAEWADRRKEEKKVKKEEENKGKREATVACVEKALEYLKGIDPAFNKELAPVVGRLEMFIKGERFTRNVKKGV